MMELLLVRHGKAQKRGTVKIDCDRKLVAKGIDQLKKDIPHLSAYIKGREKIYLWSSSITRAMETAEIIKDCCKIDKIEVQDFIETGNFDELIHILKKMQEDSTIIIVGHEPDLSEWSHMISNKDICFKKGGAVFFKLILKKEPIGEIKWIAEPGDYEYMIK